MLLSRAPAAPLFKTLSRDECESVLLHNNLGRIAFAVHDRVSIVPINYVFLNGWIYGRTSSSAKLRRILRNRRVAFEVDEQAQLFEWRSVIVHGPLYVIQADTTQLARSVYRTAVSLMRRLVPESLTENDPVPFRNQLFRIRAIEMTGRASAREGGQRLLAAEGENISETAVPEDDASLLNDAQLAIEKAGIPDDADVHLEVFDRVIVLSGTVETSRDRQAIEAELLRIPAVVAVVEELETMFPVSQDSMPSEVARAATAALRAGLGGVTPAVKVVLEHGWLRLEGTVQSEREREDAIRRLRGVGGVRGVIDRTRISRKEV